MDATDFRKLFAEAQSNDAAAQNRLAAWTLPYIEFEVRRYQHWLHDAGDSLSHWASEVALHVYEELAKCTGPPAAPSDEDAARIYLGWMKTATPRVILNLIRYGKRHGVPAVSMEPGNGDGSQAPRAPEPAVPGPTPGSFLAKLGETARVQQAVARLPSPWREIIELHHFQDISLRQIAKDRGETLDKVRKWNREGLLRLKQDLERPS